MRLLVVTPEYPPHAAGGILKYYELMAAAWAVGGADVSVLVCTPFSSFEDYEHRGIRGRSIPLAQIGRHANRLTHLAAAPLYRRWIAAGLAAADWVRTNADRFDVIETTDFGLLFAPLVSVPDRPPLVVKLHGSAGQISEHEPPAPAMELDSALARVTEAAVLPTVDALHAYSRSNAAEWEARLSRPVTFVPAPLPLPPAPPAAPRPPGMTGVVVGRIQPWKGPELLCQAFHALGRAAPPGLTVTWIGRDTAAGPEGGSTSAWLAKRYPDIWGTRVVPIGTHTAEDVARRQMSARFVVVPSSWDTFNYTLAEAMGLGCLTLGSTGAGASYLIEHGTTGFTFAPNDPQALAALLIAAVDMPEAERQRIGAAARQTVGKQLDPQAAAAASLAAFGALRTTQRPARPGPWIRDFFEPNVSGTAGIGYLENVSIRDLARHLKVRVTRKMIG